MSTVANCVDRPGLAPEERLCGIFAEDKEVVEWLADFLTGDAKMAEFCLMDAYAKAEGHSQLFPESMLPRLRVAAIIASAVQIQQWRFPQLPLAYWGRACVHPPHEPLTAAMVDFVVEESDCLRARLDGLSRLSLVMCGIEGCASWEVARLAGVSSDAIQAAYCSALESLDVLVCQEVMQSERCAATCN